MVHNKTSQKLDAKLGKIFTVSQSTVAAVKAAKPEGNARLRTAITAAKAASMPLDNVKRSILKGTSELPGVTYESLPTGLRPAGVALFLQVMTDNKSCRS
jgi:transcriptional/translational regulatory protein YebC/TACO1